jgi:hypothetical protein
MASVSRLGRQIELLVATLDGIGVTYALIGGLALASHKVIRSAEGLIGFKLQAIVNDPRRTQDLEDIRALLRANRTTLDMAEVHEYFRLFDREPLLQEILHEQD